jgi:hypothetical protein
MKAPHFIESTVLEEIASHSVRLRDVLLSFRDEWIPKDPPPYVVVAEYAEEIAKGEVEDSAIAAIMEDVESYIEGEGAAADLLAVGFLEALMARASGGRFDFRRVVGLLGPRSLEFCSAWDGHTGCITVADAKSPPKGGV